MGSDGFGMSDVVIGALSTPSNGNRKKADNNLDEQKKEESDGKDKE